MKNVVYVVFHSFYGHIFQMAKAVAEGAASVADTEVKIFRVAETVDEETLKKAGAFDAQKAFAHIPVIEPGQLTEADAIIFGTPTRFGNMSSQMRSFMDRTGGVWAQGGLIGKVGSVFTSTGTQHGGQETTITSFHTTLLHHGMVIVGVPFSNPGISITSEVSGGSPYGASTIAGGDGSRMPSENELAVARFQGEHVAKISAKLK